MLTTVVHLSPRLCPSTAGCSPPSMSSSFTSHLGFVHSLQDVALLQCFPLPSVCSFPLSDGSLLIGFCPTINALARRVFDGFFIQGVLLVVF